MHTSQLKKRVSSPVQTNPNVTHSFFDQIVALVIDTAEDIKNFQTEALKVSTLKIQQLTQVQASDPIKAKLQGTLTETTLQNQWTQLNTLLDETQEATPQAAVLRRELRDILQGLALAINVPNAPATSETLLLGQTERGGHSSTTYDNDLALATFLREVYPERHNPELESRLETIRILLIHHGVNEGEALNRCLTRLYPTIRHPSGISLDETTQWTLSLYSPALSTFPSTAKRRFENGTNNSDVKPFVFTPIIQGHLQHQPQDALLWLSVLSRQSQAESKFASDTHRDFSFFFNRPEQNRRSDEAIYTTLQVLTHPHFPVLAYAEIVRFVATLSEGHEKDTPRELLQLVGLQNAMKVVENHNNPFGLHEYNEGRDVTLSIEWGRFKGEKPKEMKYRVYTHLETGEQLAVLLGGTSTNCQLLTSETQPPKITFPNPHAFFDFVLTNYGLNPERDDNPLFKQVVEQFQSNLVPATNTELLALIETIPETEKNRLKAEAESKQKPAPTERALDGLVGKAIGSYDLFRAIKAYLSNPNPETVEAVHQAIPAKK